MPRFVVRKNTLPYVHQWAVIDTETGNKVGEYKIKKFAEKACDDFERHGLPDDKIVPHRNLRTPGTL